MASKLWLAVLLFQLATAVPTPHGEGDIAEARDFTEGFGAPTLARDLYDNSGIEARHIIEGQLIERQLEEGFRGRGTDRNAQGLGRNSGRRAGTDPVKALADATKQPELPQQADTAACKFAYRHEAKNGVLPIWEGTGAASIVDLNVEQGGIGDCGLGAAVGAVAATGHAKYLRDRLAVNGTTHTFKFTYARSPYSVKVDDQLPALSTGDPNQCLPYLGFAPAGPSRSNYVPVLEKAVAKFQDAYPESRTVLQDGVVPPNGYLGLEGIWPDIALELITGGATTRRARQGFGLDSGIVKALQRCLTVDLPCVIGTPGGSARQNYFGPSATNDFKVPYGQSYVSATITPVPVGQDYFWKVVDADNGGATNIVVPGHAWAIDKKKSRYDPNNLRASKIRILNPWGINLQPWNALDAPNAIELSFPALASLAASVFSVSSLP